QASMLEGRYRDSTGSLVTDVLRDATVANRISDLSHRVTPEKLCELCVPCALCGEGRPRAVDCSRRGDARLTDVTPSPARAAERFGGAVDRCDTVPPHGRASSSSTSLPCSLSHSAIGVVPASPSVHAWSRGARRRITLSTW